MILIIVYIQVNMIKNTFATASIPSTNEIEKTSKSIKTTLKS